MKVTNRDADGAKNRDAITGSLTSPWKNTVRWSIVPVRNKTGLYK